MFMKIVSMTIQKTTSPMTNMNTSIDDCTRMPPIASKMKAPTAKEIARKPVSNELFMKHPSTQG